MAALRQYEHDEHKRQMEMEHDRFKVLQLERRLPSPAKADRLAELQMKLQREPSPSTGGGGGGSSAGARGAPAQFRSVANEDWAAQILRSWATPKTAAYLSGLGDAGGVALLRAADAPGTTLSKSHVPPASSVGGGGGGGDSGGSSGGGGGCSSSGERGDGSSNGERGDGDGLLLPMIDSRSQAPLRRKLLMTQIDRVLPPILSGIGVGKANVRREVSALVKTFELHMDTVSFRPAQTIMLAIILCATLASRVDELSQALAKAHPKHGCYRGWWAARLQMGRAEFEGLANILQRPG
jgi:hypothetical protein